MKSAASQKGIDHRPISQAATHAARLGVKHGEITGDTEVVCWEGDDEVIRRARVPAIYFLKERYIELTD